MRCNGKDVTIYTYTQLEHASKAVNTKRAMNLRDAVGAGFLPRFMPGMPDEQMIVWLLEAQMLVAAEAGVVLTPDSLGVPKSGAGALVRQQLPASTGIRCEIDAVASQLATLEAELQAEKALGDHGDEGYHQQFQYHHQPPPPQPQRQPLPSQQPQPRQCRPPNTGSDLSVYSTQGRSTSVNSNLLALDRSRWHCPGLRSRRAW